MDPFVESEIKRVTLMLEIEYGPGKPENVKYYNEGNKYTMTFWFNNFLIGLESYKGGVSSYLGRLREYHSPEELFKEDEWFHTWAGDEPLSKEPGLAWGTTPTIVSTPPSITISNCTNCCLDFAKSPIVWSFAQDLHLCEKCMANAIRNALKLGK